MRHARESHTIAMRLSDDTPALVGTRVEAVGDSTSGAYHRGDQGLIVHHNPQDPVVLWDNGQEHQSARLKLRTIDTPGPAEPSTPSRTVALPDPNRGEGCDDRPGYSHLPNIHPQLWVGNQIAAAARAERDRPFDVVISTVPARNLRHEVQPNLSTHTVLFNDDQGRETEDGIDVARRSILEGAEYVNRALAEGNSVLVHCAWGQNRSCAICCAFAVQNRGMSAVDAIAYMRECNLRDRRYMGQHDPGGTMHNPVFRRIIRELNSSRE